MPSPAHWNPGDDAAAKGKQPVRRTHDGHRLLWLLGPHLLLGLWLFAVPADTLPTLNDLILLVHAVGSLLAVPLLVLLMLSHAQQRWRHMSAIERRRAMAAAIAVALAAGTGTAASYYGDAYAVATIHAVAGLVLLAPLGLHLVRHGAAWWPRVLAVTGATVATVVGCVLLVAPDDPVGKVPQFKYVTRPTHLYDEAAWCGECHTVQHAEWSLSHHANITPNFPDVLRETAIPHVAADLSQVPSLAAHALQGDPTPKTGFDCALCHAPTSFYGDDTTPILKAKPPSGDWITCSFCHTARGLQQDVDLAGVFRRARAYADANMPPDALQKLLKEDDPIPRLMQYAGLAGEAARQIPYYISAPETVRRYLFQADTRGWARELGNALIRWRPQRHREDYHPAFMGSGDFCNGCHGIGGNLAETGGNVAYDWRLWSSQYGGGSEPVTCQDCHMARQSTGKRTAESGRLVPWGEVRPRARSHLFLGGGTLLSQAMNKGGVVPLQRRMAATGLSVRVTSVQQTAAFTELQVAVSSHGIGHAFPSADGTLRYAYVTASLQDASGRTVAATPAKPASNHNGPELDIPVLVRPGSCLASPGEQPCDTRLPAESTRTYRVRVRHGRIDAVTSAKAQLWINVNDRPLAEHVVTLALPTVPTATTAP